MADADDWTWRVQLSPPKRYSALRMDVDAFAAGDIDDPLVIARLIGQHVGREFVNRLFEEAEEDTPSA